MSDLLVSYVSFTRNTSGYTKSTLSPFNPTEVIALSGPVMTGEIPSEVGLLTKLGMLAFYCMRNNALDIPTYLLSSSLSLEAFFLEDISVQGHLPLEVGSLPNLGTFKFVVLVACKSRHGIILMPLYLCVISYQSICTSTGQESLVPYPLLWCNKEPLYVSHCYCLFLSAYCSLDTML